MCAAGTQLTGCSGKPDSVRETKLFPAVKFQNNPAGFLHALDDVRKEPALRELRGMNEHGSTQRPWQKTMSCREARAVSFEISPWGGQREKLTQQGVHKDAHLDVPVHCGDKGWQRKTEDIRRCLARMSTRMTKSFSLASLNPYSTMTGYSGSRLGEVRGQKLLGRGAVR